MISPPRVPPPFTWQLLLKISLQSRDGSVLRQDTFKINTSAGERGPKVNNAMWMPKCVRKYKPKTFSNTNRSHNSWYILVTCILAVCMPLDGAKSSGQAAMKTTRPSALQLEYLSTLLVMLQLLSVGSQTPSPETWCRIIMLVLDPKCVRLA